MIIVLVRDVKCYVLHELGKQAISFWIEKYPETFDPGYINDDIELLLNNNFPIQHKTQGTALESKMLPT